MFPEIFDIFSFLSIIVFLIYSEYQMRRVKEEMYILKDRMDRIRNRLDRLENR
jgi:hypothetical protein